MTIGIGVIVVVLSHSRLGTPRGIRCSCGLTGHCQEGFVVIHCHSLSRSLLLICPRLVHCKRIVAHPRCRTSRRTTEREYSSCVSINSWLSLQTINIQVGFFYKWRNTQLTEVTYSAYSYVHKSGIMLQWCALAQLSHTSTISPITKYSAAGSFRKDQFQ